MAHPYSALPYNDTKPHGAADFYFGINATFRFIIRKLGLPGWAMYLHKLGTTYFSSVNESWKKGGLEAVENYWKDFFEAEPGAEVEVTRDAGHVKVNVKTCPAISHLRSHGREIVPEYCQHCFFLNNARAEEAGMCMRVEGGAGSCVHTYYADASTVGPQDISRIRRNAPC